MIKDVTNTTHFIPSRQAKTGPQPAEPDRLTAATRQELNNVHPDETPSQKKQLKKSSPVSMNLSGRSTPI